MTNSHNSDLLAPQYYQGLLNLSVNVRGTYYNDIVEREIGQSLASRIVHRIYPDKIYNYANKQLIADVSEFEPHLVWIFKGMEIYPETLLEIKRRGVKLVNYNLDHPFNYVSRGSGNKNVLKAIPLYDWHFSYSHHIIDELTRKYPGIRTSYLPFGYPAFVDKFELYANEICRVCFIGQADLKRAKVVLFLASQEIKIDVYGPDWSKFIKKDNPHITIYPPLSGKNYWYGLRKYRIQLNIFREHNFESHNMRTFEVPAIGGIMLSEASREQKDFFEEEREAFFYKDLPELLVKVKKILELDFPAAQQIRLAAKDRSIKCGYSYNERSKIALKEFNRMFYE